jgi:hypothetical protein
VNKDKREVLFMDIDFKVGLWLKNIDGEIFQVIKICDCSKCKERGFYEPVITDCKYNHDYITVSEYETGFKNWIATSDNPKDLVDNPLEFKYKNWENVISDRSIDGNSIRIFYGHTEYHPEDQWLMEALDLDKVEKRTFAMKDILKFY